MNADTLDDNSKLTSGAGVVGPEGPLIANVVPPAVAARVPHRFPVLDALRGVAAVAVVMMHGDPYLRWNVFPHANLAVDFFFMLSGFVLTLAYQGRLDAGWPMKEFMKARAIRLYPLYGLGLALGFGVELVRVLGGGKGIGPKYLAVFLVLGSLMLPTPPQIGAGMFPAFPLNLPSWSLFSEMVANVLHAAFLRRRSTGQLVGVVAVAGAALLWVEMRRGAVYVGLMSSESVYAVARVMVSYTLGMLLFRVWSAGRVRLKAPAALVAVLLLIVLVTPELRTLRYEMGYEVTAIFVLFPVVLLAGTRAGMSERMSGVATVLGQASYAVYVLHVPVVSGMHLMWTLLLHRRMEDDAPWSGMVFVVLVFGLALLMDRVYDLPVRGWLQRRFGGKRRVAGPKTSTMGVSH